MQVDRLGRYEVVRHLAHGGMATVYLARLNGIGGFERHVVLKTLHEDMVADDTLVLTLPERKLARVEVAPFAAHVPSGGRLAGLVKKAEKGPRELVPLVFAEVRVPHAKAGGVGLRGRVPSGRWVWVWDERRRVGYLLVAPREGDWRNVPARNHINVFTAHAVVALPGGVGTHNELAMAATYCGEPDRSREQRRTILIGPAEEFTPEHRALFVHATSIAAAESHLCRILRAAGFPLPEEASARAS